MKIPLSVLTWIILLIIVDGLKRIPDVSRVVASSSSPFTTHQQQPQQQQGVNLGPIRLWPSRLFGGGKQQFTWRAAVNRKTATCTSRESSNIPRRSKLGKSLQRLESESKSSLFRLPRIWGRTSNNNNALHRRHARQQLSNIWAQYPYWLVRKRVTLGLLKACRDDKNKRIVRIQDRIFGWHIISFGPVQRQMVLSASSSSAGRDERKRNDNKRRGNNSCLIILSLPILGGIMTTEGDKRTKEPCKYGLRKRPPIRPRKHYGALSMCVHQHHHHHHHRQQEVSPSSASQPAATRSYRMETSIDGYKARLVGEGSPSSFRKWFYLSTQSVVHVYVMWRFHHFSRSQDL